jgi:hypothetical protein
MSCNDEIIINQNTTQNSVFVNELSASNSIQVIAGGGSLVITVNGMVGNVVITPSTIGLGNVDNTSDVNKPISNATLSALLLKTDLSAFNVLNNFILTNYGTWDSTTFTVNSLSSNWNAAYTWVNTNSANLNYDYTWVAANSSNATFNSVSAKSLSGVFYGDGRNLIGVSDVFSTFTSNSAVYNTLFTTPLSTLTYENVEASNIYDTIQEYAASNPLQINKGSNVTLSNGRVYTFAGTDASNPSQYLEINANPITPIYQEFSIYNQTSGIVDIFNVSDFKSAKYTLQVETNYNNEIYYSEINIVASVGSQIAVASEYGQIYTSNIILGYTANYNINRVQLIILFSSDTIYPTEQIIIKGHRTNFYKI